MEKTTVFIKIQGFCCTGKTTIAVKLARALKKCGITTEVWEYDDQDIKDITDSQIEENLKTLSSKIRVVIQTEQIKRHCI